MGHHAAARRAVGPEPDEGDARHALALEYEPHGHLHQVVNGHIYGPSWELDPFPTSEAHPLKIFSEVNGQNRPEEIIDSVRQRRSPVLRSRGSVKMIPLIEEVVDDLRQIKRKRHASVLCLND